MKSSISKIAVGIGALFVNSVAIADSGVSGEVGYIMNTLLLLLCGVLVMFMAAGFRCSKPAWFAASLSP